MKATKAIIRQRVEEILSIRLAGAQFVDIRQYVSEKSAAGESPWATEKDTPSPNDRTLWRYVAASDKLMADSCREGRKRVFRRHQAQRRHLYGLAVIQGDVRAALAVLDSEAKLLSLFDADLVQQLEELRKQLAELKGHHGDGTPQTADQGPTGGSSSAGRPEATGVG